MYGLINLKPGEKILEILVGKLFRKLLAVKKEGNFRERVWEMIHGLVITINRKSESKRKIV